MSYTRSNIAKLPGVISSVSPSLPGFILYSLPKCTDPDQRRIRGMIFNGDELVSSTHGHSIELPTPESIRDYFENEPFEQYKFVPSLEGTRLLFFFANGGWHISTHNNIDAFASMWGSSRSFGSLLIDSLQESRRNDASDDCDDLELFCSELDPSKQYVFLLMCTKETRIACPAPEYPGLIHTGTFKCDVELNEPFESKHYHVYPQDVLPVEDVESLIEGVDQAPSNTRGIVAFGPNSRVVRMDNPRYAECAKIRGTASTLEKRYYQLRMNGDRREIFCEMFDDETDRFDREECAIYTLAKKLYSAYREFYIQRSDTRPVLPPKEFGVVKRLNKWHREDREKNLLSLERVMQELNSMQPDSLYHLIHPHTNRKKKTVSTKWTRLGGVSKNVRVKKSESSVPLTVANAFSVLGNASDSE